MNVKFLMLQTPRGKTLEHIEISGHDGKDVVCHIASDAEKEKYAVEYSAFKAFVAPAPVPVTQYKVEVVPEPEKKTPGKTEAVVEHEADHHKRTHHKKS